MPLSFIFASRSSRLALVAVAAVVFVACGPRRPRRAPSAPGPEAFACVSDIDCPSGTTCHKPSAEHAQGNCVRGPVGDGGSPVLGVPAPSVTASPNDIQL